MLVMASACGGSGKGAKDPTGTGTSGGGESKDGTGAGTSGGNDDPTKPDKPAKKGQYPEPFLEPDCSSVATDGYLPDAKNAVIKVHRDSWDKLKHCADGQSDIHGEVRVSFRLDPDGVPRCVEAPGSSLANEDVVNCVISVYRTFHYPSPKNGSVRVTDGIGFDETEDDDD